MDKKIIKQKEFASGLSARLNEIVKATGLTQREFGNDINEVANKKVQFRTIQSWLNDELKKGPPGWVVPFVCKKYGVNPAYLMCLTDEPMFAGNLIDPETEEQIEAIISHIEEESPLFKYALFKNKKSREFIKNPLLKMFTEIAGVFSGANAIVESRYIQKELENSK